MSEAPSHIPLVEPHIGGNEWQYVKECLDAGWVSGGGAYGERFERELACVTGVRHAVAVSSGTAALHLALLAAGVGAGDEVLVSDLTFIAPVNAVRYAGGAPVLVDVDPHTWQMDVALVEEFLAACTRRGDGACVNARTGKRVAAVVPVHILGGGVDMPRLLAVCARFGVPVVEDATESLGARMDGKALGSFGASGCLSFNGNKAVTTGGGGAIVTDDEAVARRVRYLANQAKDDPREFRHDGVGFNYRLSNVLAAIGCAQLERLDEFVARKRRLEERYRAGLGGVAGVGFMEQTPGVASSCWLTTVRLDAARFGASSRDVIAALAQARIEARPLWTAIHENAPYRESEIVTAEGSRAPTMTTSSTLQRACVSLPSSFGLTDHDQDRVIDVVVRSAHGS